MSSSQMLCFSCIPIHEWMNYDLRENFTNVTFQIVTLAAYAKRWSNFIVNVRTSHVWCISNGITALMSNIEFESSMSTVLLNMLSCEGIVCESFNTNFRCMSSFSVSFICRLTYLLICAYHCSHKNKCVRIHMWTSNQSLFRFRINSSNNVCDLKKSWLLHIFSDWTKKY